MTESPLRNILLMKRSLFTGADCFLPLEVLGTCRHSLFGRKRCILLNNKFSCHESSWSHAKRLTGLISILSASAGSVEILSSLKFRGTDDRFISSGLLECLIGLILRAHDIVADLF